MIQPILEGLDEMRSTLNLQRPKDRVVNGKAANFFIKTKCPSAYHAKKDSESTARLRLNTQSETENSGR